MFTCDAISCSILIYNSMVHRENATHIVRYLLDVVNYANVVNYAKQDAVKLVGAPGLRLQGFAKAFISVVYSSEEDQKNRESNIHGRGLRTTASDCRKIKANRIARYATS